MSTASPQPSFAGKSRPAWEIALIFPEQGEWDEIDYLELTSSMNRFVELVDGQVRVLPMPTTAHQRILVYLMRLLDQFVTAGVGGLVLPCVLRVRLGPRHFREPDIVVMLQANLHRAKNDAWEGADLVVEIVSDDEKSRNRDWVEKKRDYAEGGVREYWVVDPQQEVIAVFSLPEGGGEYATHGEFRPGTKATSVLLAGFEADVKAVFDAGKAGD